MLQAKNKPNLLFIPVELAISLYKIFYECTYNIDDLYHIERIDPLGMVKIVYITGAYICDLL